MTISKTITLHNGVEMPRIGYGTFRMKDHDVAYQGVTDAIKIGYRHIDTAAIYENEEAVGRAIKDAGIPREELFITTKVWNSDQGYDQTLKAFETSLNKLGLDYVDQYLVHWPKPTLKETYKAIERLYDEKLVRAPGVSNFQRHHLEEIFASCNIKPTVNQIEVHPSMSQNELRAFCEKHNIAITAWAPLGTGIAFTHPVIRRLVIKYDKTPAQIVLRWQLEVGNIAIPKSVSIERLEQNLNIFEFALTAGEVADISALNTNHRTSLSPDGAYVNPNF